MASLGERKKVNLAARTLVLFSTSYPKCLKNISICGKHIAPFLGHARAYDVLIRCASMKKKICQRTHRVLSFIVLELILGMLPVEGKVELNHGN